MAADEQFDLVVVGAGPGGYVAAIRAAQLGLRTALVDKWKTLGGTCLNIGCIPSKALLDSSELYARMTTHASHHGFDVGEVQVDLATLHKKKDGVVKKLVNGVSQLMKSKGVTVFTGAGGLADATTVEVTAEDGSTQMIAAKNILLATGSVPQELPFLPFDGRNVVSSREALEFDEVPGELVVIGAGAIGLELGSVWARLGSKVTVVEIMPAVLPGWDAQVSKSMQRELGKQGMTFALETKVTGARQQKKKTVLTATDKNGAEVEFRGDKVLVAVGRRPYTDGLGAEELGIEFDGRQVRIDEQFRTNVEGIYAIGDIVHGPMLAHKAEDEGIAVAEIVAGKPGHVNYEAIPNVVYTWPEVAAVGRTEKELKEASIDYRKGQFPFSANGRALAMDSPQGFVKILADSATDRILGVHIVGPMASDMIAQAVTAMEFAGSAEDLARTVHAHPTLPEAVREAALAVDGRSIHGK